MTFQSGFRQLRNCIEDDAFMETVLGSQGNKEDLERFAAAKRSDDEGNEWQSH
jgi:hypothetical protein